MNKDELTKILKPLIKECVKEVIMEEPGVLAHIIKESVQGVSVSTITESRDEEPIRKFMKKAQKAKPKRDLNETRKRLLDSIGGAGNFGGVNIFEGTEPLAAAPSSQQEKFGALRDTDPNDAGVDLSALDYRRPMRKYNKSSRGKFEEYDRKLDKKRKKYGKKINALDGIEPYQVEVRNGDVMKAYKVLERMLKKDRILETYRERQYYKKPSDVRSEEKRRKKRRQEKERIRRQLEEAKDNS